MKGVNEYGGNEKVLVTICYEAAASLYQFGYSVLLIQKQWSFGSKMNSLHLIISKVFHSSKALKCIQSLTPLLSTQLKIQREIFIFLPNLRSLYPLEDKPTSASKILAV